MLSGRRPRRRRGRTPLIPDSHTNGLTVDAASLGLPAAWVPRAISAARTLQPLWSQPDSKPPRFEDGLEAAKSRFTGIVSALNLDVPKELAQ